MKKIALISCDNKKKTGFNFVKDIDKESQLFKLSMNYGKSIADEIFILTTRYGLIKEKDYTTLYNETSEFKSEMENKLWALEILEQLNNFTNIHEDEYVILANQNYYKNYVKFLNKVELPLKNMSVDDKISYLKKELNDNEEDKKSYKNIGIRIV